MGLSRRRALFRFKLCDLFSRGSRAEDDKLSARVFSIFVSVFFAFLFFTASSPASGIKDLDTLPLEFIRLEPRTNGSFALCHEKEG